MNLPLGYDDFGEIRENRLSYIDKSLFIQDILNDPAKVIMITRPRRFGKTCNLSLLHHFLSSEVRGVLTRPLFESLKIEQISECMQHQGQYPVIFISFKDIKHVYFKNSLDGIQELMARVYDQHGYIENSPQLTKSQKAFCQLIFERKANRAQLESALSMLVECLSVHHHIKPWLLIDEYDTPIQAVYGQEDTYPQLLEFMRAMLGSVLKGNPYLNRAVIIGILRVAKESLFSGLNNVEVYSLLRDEYSPYFGFTEPEVDAILKQANLTHLTQDIRTWYNGYQIGQSLVYNPWSIINCVKRKGILEPYWINTGDNEWIKHLLKQSPLTFKKEFEHLMQGRSTQQVIGEHLVFAHLKSDSSSVWSLLLMSGYLTTARYQARYSGIQCDLRVPNQEVNYLYQYIIQWWLSNDHELTQYLRFIKALVSGDMETFEHCLQSVMLNIVSYHDLSREPEAFFHGLLLGFIAGLRETHEIRSNREAGDGLYDIALIPRDPNQLGIVIELKKAPSKAVKSTLKGLAQKAIQQIDDKRYMAEFNQKQIRQVLKIGIAFQLKAFALCHAQHFN